MTWDMRELNITGWIAYGVTFQKSPMLMVHTDLNCCQRLQCSNAGEERVFNLIKQNKTHA